MRYEEFVRMEAQGDSHWWYQARRSLLRLGLERMVPGTGPLRILDLASACGGNFATLGEYGQAVGIDISDHALRYCREKGVRRVVKGDVQSLPFAGAAFDAVVSFDVYEHLNEDLDAMRETARVLKPGGLLLVNVPAFMALFSDHDRAFEHRRRYTRSELCGKLEAAGFRVGFSSYWSFFIFPAVYAVRRLMPSRSLGRGSDFHLRVPRVADQALDLLSRLEVAIMRRGIGFPLGVSLYLLAWKAGGADRSDTCA